MNSQSFEKNPNSTELKIARLEQFALQYLSDNSSYHHHKENMAHGGLLLQTALLGGILAFDTWPPVWVPDCISLGNLNISKEEITFLCYSIIWILIHIFIRWQLRNRKLAALRHGGLIRTLVRLINEQLEEEDLQPPDKKQKENIFKRFLIVFFDSLVPLPKAIIKADV